MDWQEVLNRIESGESHSTEFKRGIGSDLEPVGKSVCAFANGRGGLIVIGVNDDGRIAGLNSDPHKVHEQLTSFLGAGLSSPVTARCGRHEVDLGWWVHWIEVFRHQGPSPLQYKSDFYVRRERSSVKPSPTAIHELFNAYGFVITEEQVIPTASWTDIDVDSFRSLLRKKGIDIEDESKPSIDDDLRNGGLARRFDGALCPTLYGLLAFGKRPQSHRQTDNLLIRCTAYEGTDPSSNVIGAGMGDGTLPTQVLRAIAWFKALGWTEEYSRLTRKGQHIIPELAIREALVNAVVHRDYAITGSSVIFDVYNNRVVVTSPGTLPNHMTIESLKLGNSRTRNQMMANVMSEIGFMEKRGRGWVTMRRAMNEHNGTIPEIVNDAVNKFVRVTFFR